MRRLLWALLLMLPLGGHAGTLEDKAIEAFRYVQTQEHHKEWEYGGILVWRDWKLIYVDTTSHRIDYLENSPRNLMLPGDILVGVFHTHPCAKGYWTGLYSMNDIMQQVYWQVPSFLLDQCTMKVHEFDLGKDHVLDTGKTVQTPNGKHIIHLPAGRLIGHL